ncbi:MAG: hypothetical protein ACRC33_21505 [Gemmataceae bacterium]
MPLAEWLTRPGFVVVAVKAESKGGKQLVRMEYTYQDPHPRDPSLPERSRWSGWHLLDPNDFWVIHESYVKAWHGADSITVQARERIGGYPIGHRTVLAGFSPAGKRTAEYVWETANLKARTASDDEFTLSAFGLPEPSFAPRRFANWTILLALAAIFAAVALALRRVARRQGASA